MVSFAAGWVCGMIFVVLMLRKMSQRAGATQIPAINDTAVTALRKIERVIKIQHAHKLATEALNEIDK